MAHSEIMLASVIFASCYILISMLCNQKLTKKNAKPIKTIYKTYFLPACVNDFIGKKIFFILRFINRILMQHNLKPHSAKHIQINFLFFG